MAKSVKRRNVRSERAMPRSEAFRILEGAYHKGRQAVKRVVLKK